MIYFRMKLETVQGVGGDGSRFEGGYRYIIGYSHDLEGVRKPDDGVGMAHPDLALCRHRPKQGFMVMVLQQGTPIFPVAAFGYFSSETLGHQLGSVTDAQHWYHLCQWQDIRLRGLGVIYGKGTS
jgi:hypothetical protein